jgi:hypothetical protein
MRFQIRHLYWILTGSSFAVHTMADGTLSGLAACVLRPHGGMWYPQSKYGVHIQKELNYDLNRFCKRDKAIARD